MWDTNGLFEALDEIAIAQPTSQNRAAVTSFANVSERYFDAYLKPIPAYAPYLGARSSHTTMWFDDNGWIGLGFLDAYRATANHRYLTDAERAFAFIAAEGWDGRQGGGMWWNTAHGWLSGESLAAAAELAARLYETTRKTTYLKIADKYVTWANKHLLRPSGIYSPNALTRNPYLVEPNTPPPAPPTARLKMVPMPPDGEGSMLAAITSLCEATGKQSWCKAAEKLAAALLVRMAPYTTGAQYDSVLVRGVLALYAHDHKASWYRFAVGIARLIQAHARTGPGLYLRRWDGRPLRGAVRGALRIDAGSVAVFADLATVLPPSSAHPAAGTRTLGSATS